MNSQDTLGSALEAFIREHEYCGELDTGLDDDRVWMTCTWPRGIHPRSPPTRRPDRRRHGACLEWLSAHGGVSVWRHLGAVGYARGCRAGSAPAPPVEL